MNRYRIAVSAVDIETHIECESMVVANGGALIFEGINRYKVGPKEWQKAFPGMRLFYSPHCWSVVAENDDD